MTGAPPYPPRALSHAASPAVSVAPGAAEDLEKIRLLRILRVLRLIKLMRLVRASRLFKRWETRLEINYGKLAVAKCIILIVLASHWFACIWGLQASLHTSPEHTWKGHGSEGEVYCRPVPDEIVEEAGSTAPRQFSCEKASADSPNDFRCWQCDSELALYVAALYFSMMTITSIGYGDLAATPRNTVEQAIAVMLMLFGAMAWGQVIATFCRIIANMDPESNDFSRRMDDLNRFMRKEMLPADMRRRLREYFHQTRHLQVHAANRTLLQMLSPTLQGEVVWCTNERWLRRIWFFAKAEHQFMVEVALALVPMVFSPGEIATNGYMYIVHRGIALYGGRVLTTGMVWGEAAGWKAPSALPEDRAPSAALGRLKAQAARSYAPRSAAWSRVEPRGSVRRPQERASDRPEGEFSFHL